jgi:hypothetical protein
MSRPSDLPETVDEISCEAQNSLYDREDITEAVQIDAESTPKNLPDSSGAYGHRPPLSAMLLTFVSGFLVGLLFFTVRIVPFLSGIRKSVRRKRRR